MSGKPSSDGVAQARYFLYHIDLEEESIARLQAENEKILKDLESAKIRLHRVTEKKNKLMTKMDLVHSGNTGYEQRMHWFLVELSRQIRTREVPVEPIEE